MAYRVRKAIPSDIPEMIRLERHCSTVAHWTEQQYRTALGDQFPRLVLIAYKEGIPRIAGFLVARHLSQEWELENILVAEKCQGKGIGMQLMDTFLVHAAQTNAVAVLLEVRESNAAARKLYEKSGFREHGRRSGYYAQPSESAVLYCKTLE